MTLQHVANEKASPLNGDWSDASPLNVDWSDASPLNVDWSDASPLDVDWSDAMWTVFVCRRANDT
ncbi:putative inositol polyphosphate 5-phosphatase C9G1.10c, partial [Fusarium oxysporum f. sp. albedinis]